MDVPPVNFVENGIRFRLSMCAFKVIAHPINEVVLEHALYQLVEKIWCDQLVNVGARKVICERLREG